MTSTEPSGTKAADCSAIADLVRTDFAALPPGRAALHNLTRFGAVSCPKL